MTACSALIVDGDWKIRKLIGSNLRAHGLDVHEATDARTCLGALKGNRFDLILLAASLPDANGWNVVWQLRRQLVSAQVPIVVIVSEPADHRLLGRFPSVSQLLKPFSALDLLRCVDQALGGVRHEA
jgi:DNA-binding response OmpR family regulator